MPLPIRRARKRIHSEAGSMLLETVIALAIVLPILFGLFDVCRLMYSCTLAVYAGESGLDYAAIHGIDAGANSCSGPGCLDSSGQNIIHVVNQGLNGGLIGSSVESKTVTSVSWQTATGTGTPTAPEPGSIVLLTMKVPFNSYLLPTSLTTFQFQFRGHVEY